MTAAGRGLLGAAVVLVLAGLTAANLWMGDLNQDEGWYLYAATQVAEGRLPYVDFSYTQAPVLPLVYALATPVIDAMGVAGGRAVTALLGLAALAVAARAAGIAAGRSPAMLLTVVLGGINVYQSYFTTIVKTYALCALFLALGVWALARVVRQPGWRMAVVAGIAFALAAGVRISSGAALPVVFVILVLEAFRGRFPWAPVIGFAVGGGVALLLVLGPWFALAPESAWFHLVAYHSARDAGGLLPLLVYKAGFLSRMVQAYFVAVAAAVGLALIRWLGHDRTPWLPDAAARMWFRAVAGIVLAISLVHLAAPFPYDDYQVPLFPLAAALLAVAAASCLARLPAAPRASLQAVLAAFLLCTAAAASSPVNQAWMIAGRDRIWWRLKPAPAMPQLRDAADRVRALAPGTTLLTQDIYLAVEAGLDVPPGLEMGPFSYYPDLDHDRAATLNVINRAALESLLATSTIPVAAVSDYGFSIASPDIEPVPDHERARFLRLLEARYTEVDRIETFGQAGTTLRLYTLKPEAAP